MDYTIGMYQQKRIISSQQLSEPLLESLSLLTCHGKCHVGSNNALFSVNSIAFLTLFFFCKKNKARIMRFGQYNLCFISCDVVVRVMGHWVL